MVRRGEPVAEVIRLAERTAGQAVFMAGDVSRYATRRQERLERECARHRLALEITPGHAVVPPGEVRPAGGSHYPDLHALLARLASRRLAAALPGAAGHPGPARRHAGRPARAGRALLPVPGAGRRAGGPGAAAGAWLDGPLGGYGEGRDDLADPQTSRLSAYLRFGCISPIELARAALPRPGGEEFCRQLAWRDFFHQVTAAFPDIARTDYRTRSRVRSPDVVGRRGSARRVAGGADRLSHRRCRDAAARRRGVHAQPGADVTASFLTRTLGIDWRPGPGTSATCWPTAT